LTNEEEEEVAAPIGEVTSDEEMSSPRKSGRKSKSVPKTILKSPEMKKSNKNVQKKVRIAEEIEEHELPAQEEEPKKGKRGKQSQRSASAKSKKTHDELASSANNERMSVSAASSKASTSRRGASRRKR
jgi:hypothetical protein